MDALFIILLCWTFYSIYKNVIVYHDYKYLYAIVISGSILWFFITSRTWWLILTLLATNLYYLYLMLSNVREVLSQLGQLIK